MVASNKSFMPVTPNNVTPPRLSRRLSLTPFLHVQSYFGQQMAMFANGLAQRLAQHGHQVPPDLYKASAREVFQLMTSEPAGAVQTDKELQLVFRHDCLCVPTCFEWSKQWHDGAPAPVVPDS